MTKARVRLRRGVAASACLVLFGVLFGLVRAELESGAAWAADRPAFHGHLSQFIYLKPPDPVRPTGFREVTGGMVDFAMFRGKIVLVNLWATWCAPCAAEMPTLDRLQAVLGGDRFAVVAIALDTEGLSPVTAFFRRQNLTHLQIYLDAEHRTVRPDAGDGTGPPFPLYQLPISYLLDEQGRAVGYLKGPADWDSPQAIGFLQYFIQRVGGP